MLHKICQLLGGELAMLHLFEKSIHEPTQRTYNDMVLLATGIGDRMIPRSPF